MDNALHFGGQRLLYCPRKERYQPENRKRCIIEILCKHVVDQTPTGKILKDYDNDRNDHQNYDADLSRNAAYDLSLIHISCSEWWLRFLDQEQFIGTWQVPLLRNGFRLVVFSIIIMVVVLFYRQSMFGMRELPDILRGKRGRRTGKGAVK